MSRTMSLAACAAGTLLIAIAYLSAFIPGGPSWGVWCMIAGLALLCPGVMALGTRHRSRRSTLLNVALVLTAVALAVGFGLAVALPGSESATSLLVLGFPVRAASVLYIVGVAPLFVLPAVYAITFDTLTLTDDDIARVRAARRPDSTP
ncbi:MAG: hypothetical protein H7066_14100 [Cytophagaceae bacterium]|nr:hypothetical protein [Gemmatimonadaceae bacterium]